jgi:DNA-directed RNA polymerase beta subunit
MPDVDLNLLDPPAHKDKPAEPVRLRAFGDAAAARHEIYHQVFDAASTLPAVSNKTHTLKLTNVRWVDPAQRSHREENETLLGGRSLHRRLAGQWELSDNATGKVLDKRRQVILRVPHLTDNGTFIRNGADYILRHQERLKPGIFTRVKENGELEAHVNVLSGGPSHRVGLDPGSGVFKINIGQANIPAMPLLRALGASEDELKQAWGQDLYARNYAKADGGALSKLVEKFMRKLPEGVSEGEALRAKFAQMKLDPAVTRRTLGQAFDSPGKDALVATTRKLLAVSHGEAKPDDRDHMAFQNFLGPEDLMRERLTKDRAGVRRQLLFKASMRGDLKGMPSSALQDQLESAFGESGLGEHLQEVNGLELLDKATLVTRLGEGGIPNIESAPREARSVQPSHYGFVDPLRTPESLRAGLDTYLAAGAKKGSDGNLYSAFKDPRTGQTQLYTPQQVADRVVTFPAELDQPGKSHVRVIKNGQMTWARKRDVELVLPHFEHAFSPLNNLVPLKSMIKGQRAAMASRMLTQALALKDGESPLVQSGVPGAGGNRSYEDVYGKHLGAVRAKQGGRLLSSDPDGMHVQYDDGTVDHLDLYNNRVYNRKSFLHQTPTVRPGERFAPDQLLTRSNFTDGNGAAALGVNARVAFLPWGGQNHEDAIVISESLAKRMTSDHAYQHQLEVTDRTRSGLKPYIALFPAKYDKKTLANMDNHGLVKPGTVVKYGEPLILAAEQREAAQNRLHKHNAAAFTDASLTWQHHDPGVVTSVTRDARGGPVVVVKSQHPAQVGDKASGRFGNKGIIASILPDAHMPHDQSGQHFEAAINPLGVVSRTNPAVWAEAKLGQIAAKLGRPIKVEDFNSMAVPDRVAWVRQLMAQHNVADTEDITDPVKGTKIPGVFTGNSFLMKLQHTSESKLQGRGGGGYTAFGEPAKGGAEGSKRMSIMNLNALLSHGALHNIEDSHLIRGQNNPDYWLQFMQGYSPRQPKTPLVYQKFLADLKGAGINVVRDGTQLHMMALTAGDVDKLAGDRNLRSGDTVDFGDQLKPIEGGLFDPTLTGGHHGNRWSAIPLAEPMPSPAMEEPIRRVLDLTQKKFQAVLAGKETLANGESGPGAIAKALKGIDIDKELPMLRQQIASNTGTARDKAVRKLGYFKSAKRLDVHPGDWMLDRVPVLPPQFRPVSVLGGKRIPLVSDANFLYRELHAANQNLQDMTRKVGTDNVGEERLAVYQAFKAVTGLGDPLSAASKEKQIKGILGHVFSNSPKFSTMQRHLLSSTVDNVGRGVISPDSELDMDSVGLPEDKAFDVYQRFIARRLHREGMPLINALAAVKDRTPQARKVLLEEMEQRPVIVDRAPVLHRFGIMAFKPRLEKGSTMKMSPLVLKGMNADFDGDNANFHVPVSDKARDEALDRMLPSRQLISPADMKTPMHTPTQEFLGGLWTATTKKTQRSHHFRNFKDMQQAYGRGDVDLGDTVTLLEEMTHKA